MSRIGKKPIEIPQTVKVTIENQKILVEGPKGKLEKKLPTQIGVKIENNKIIVFPKTSEKNIKALWGTIRQLIFNMVEGVSKGFEKKLEIKGLGYKAQVEGENLVLSVGFAHPLIFKIPKELKVTVDKNIISVFGIDKELVGQFAAKIREIRPAEPYKEKGIKYLGEKIIRKVPKKAKMAK